MAMLHAPKEVYVMNALRTSSRSFKIELADRALDLVVAHEHQDVDGAWMEALESFWYPRIGKVINMSVVWSDTLQEVRERLGLENG